MELRKFYYDLVLFSRRPHNHKNTKIEDGPLGHMLPLKCSLSPSETKNSHPPSSSFWEIRFPQQKGAGALWRPGVLIRKPDFNVWKLWMECFWINMICWWNIQWLAEWLIWNKSIQDSWIMLILIIDITAMNLYHFSNC